MTKKARRYCTVPKVFGLRDWFVSRFNDLCKEHDRRYQNREGYQLHADWQMVKGMAKRGYPVTAGITMTVFLVAGWLLWYDIIPPDEE